MRAAVARARAATRTLALAAGLCAGAAGALHAQARIPLGPRPAVSVPPFDAAAGAVLAAQEETPPTLRLLLGGLAGGGVGTLVGGYLGALVGQESCLEGECLGPIVRGGMLGGALGESLGIATGVHLAGAREGPLAAQALASVALAGAGVLALGATDYETPWAPVILVAVPVAQLATTILLELR